jgi:hypothetical protein
MRLRRRAIRRRVVRRQCGSLAGPGLVLPADKLRLFVYRLAVRHHENDKLHLTMKGYGRPAEPGYRRPNPGCVTAVSWSG